MDPDPAISITNLRDAKKKLSAFYVLKIHLHHFSKIKSQKEVTKQYESRFSLLFLIDDRKIRIPSLIRIRTYD